ncbi:Ig-like domain-containing protein [Psychrobacillus sp. NEAU-3TGS]|uniref:Ig-like domain-containing protein n=1 Tax=Psychrobacillus sp. NEAU-3TGS TaxID=2995412 RepID=UPI002496205D|nr:Ig-like domain-containing protein [Psychrobacillus sp. NEAU-3TGS]MDI2588033.1 Ig-like domain-containing protein [Psychrobacillus sp. NEAU-3TGS]
MALKKVSVVINGSRVELTKNPSTGKYEGTIAAPNMTSFNVNAGHYYPITVEAEDLAGNVTSANDSDSALGESLKLFVKETTKPTILITSPASGAYIITNKPAITFQLRDETNGSGIKISSLTIKVDSGTTLTNTSPGVVVTSVTGGYNVTYTPQTALSDGSHTILLNVQDNDGNAATAVSRTFTVDTVPPILNVSSPAEVTSYQNVASLTVLGTTNDATSSPVGVTVKLNTGAATATVVDGNGNFSKTLTLVEGTNTIVITATDAAGKTSSVTRTVVLDTVAPVVSSITIAPNPVNVGQSYIITVDVTD